MSVHSKMTAIADKIRTLLGLSGKLGLDAMASNLGTAVNACDSQSELIAQIKTALEGKAAGGGGQAVADFLSYQPSTQVNIFSNSELRYPRNYALIKTTFQKIYLPEIIYVSRAMFSECEYLEEVDVSNAEKVEESAFSYCPKLQKLDFNRVKEIDENAFCGCETLNTLILRGSSICKIKLTAFAGTKIASGEGFVYVPSQMYEEYRYYYESSLNQAIGKGAFDFIFRKIEDYPEICG